jgi:hypothetical protein
MAIAPKVTFLYDFPVQRLVDPSPHAGSATVWSGDGSGTAYLHSGPGLLGTKPRFELKDGWLTLTASDGWTHPLPIHWFSDVKRRPPGVVDRTEYNRHLKDLVEEAKRRGPIDSETFARALAEARRRSGLTRDITSFSVFVGGTLATILHSGDQLTFSRIPVGDFYAMVETT